MKVAITGGAGFIGSTIASACSDAGMIPIIIDDLSSGLRAFAERFDCYLGDYGDPALVARLLDDHPDLDAVVHCAASIVVPESISHPLEYYANNVSPVPGFLRQILAGSSCRRVLFSSTAAMYDAGDDLVVDEEAPVRPLSPYAASKQMVERILADTAAVTDLRVIVLRYFNPIGADPWLRTGLQVEHPSHALGRLFETHAAGSDFSVTGTDWPTRDGSGLRDYVHVWDLALAHVAALRRFDAVFAGPTTGPGYDVINLGAGRGTTVLELVDAFRSAVGSAPQIVSAPRRAGDVAGCCASAEKAARVLGWRAERDLVTGISDALAWSRRLPSVPRD